MRKVPLCWATNVTALFKTSNDGMEDGIKWSLHRYGLPTLWLNSVMTTSIHYTVTTWIGRRVDCMLILSAAYEKCRRKSGFSIFIQENAFENDVVCPNGGHIVQGGGGGGGGGGNICLMFTCQLSLTHAARHISWIIRDSIFNSMI